MTVLQPAGAKDPKRQLSVIPGPTPMVVQIRIESKADVLDIRVSATELIEAIAHAMEAR